MAFTLNGTTIEVTGAHDSLAGIEALSGVTRIGDNDTGQNGFYAYEFDNRNISLQSGATLTIDPDRELALFKTNCPFPHIDYQNGTLNLGRKTTKNTKDRYSYGWAVVRTAGVVSGFDTGTNGTLVSTVNGGTFNGYGGGVNTRGPISLPGTANNERSGTVNIESFYYGLLEGTGAQLRFDNILSQPVNVSGLEVDGGGSDNARVLFANDYQSFSARFINGLTQTFFNADQDLTFTDLQFADNQEVDHFIFNGNSATDMVTASLVNTDIGSATNAVKAASNNNDDALEFLQDVRLSVKNAAGTALQDVKIYTQDTDDANRLNPRKSPAVDWVSDRTYLETTDANGAAGLQYQTATVIPTQGVSGKSGYSYKTQSGDNTDGQAFKMLGYAYLPFTTPVTPLKGNGGVDIAVSLVADTAITEASKTVVDAYTEIKTAPQFYDRAKSYLYDTFAGETALLATRNGDTIDLGSYDLDIDADAASVFTVSGNKITLKADTFTGHLITTGTITLLNGAIVEGARTDQNGTVIYAVLTLANLPVGAEVRLYEHTAGDTAFGPEIAGIESNSGPAFTFAHTRAGALIMMQVIAPGYVEYRQEKTLNSFNETLTLSLEAEENI